jgi:chromosome segregation ATPase
MSNVQERLQPALNSSTVPAKAVQSSTVSDNVDVNKLWTKIRSDQEAIKKAQQEKVAAEEQLQEVRQLHNESVKQLSAMEDEVATSKAQFEEARQEKQTCEDELEEARRDLSDLREQLSSTTDQMQAKDALARRSKSQIATMRSVIGHLTESIKQSNDVLIATDMMADGEEEHQGTPGLLDPTHLKKRKWGTVSAGNV